MGIFNELNCPMQSDITDLVVRAENPEKMIRQIIADIQTALDRAVQNYERVKSSRILAEKNYQDAVRISQEWENKAHDALVHDVLAHDDMRLAEQALAEKSKADDDTENYREIYYSVSEKTEIMKIKVETLEAKLKMIKEQQVSLIKLAKLNAIDRKLAELESFDESQETDVSDKSVNNSEKAETFVRVLSEVERLISEI